MKIQTKTIALVFSLILVTGLVITIFSVTISKNIVEQAVYERLESAAHSRANHIETFLEIKKEAINQLSASLSIEQFLSAKKDDPDYTQKRDTVTRRLKDTAEIGEYTLSVFVLDKNGIIVASNEETDIGKDKCNGSYFLCAKEEAFARDDYLSSIIKNVITFSAPVLDEENDDFLGVVVGRYSMEPLNKIATDMSGLGENGEIYLVNKDGYMITPSRFVNDTFRKQKVETENASNWFREVQIFGAQEHREKVVFYKNYLGTEVIGVYVHIPEMNWSLCAEMSEEEVFAPITRLMVRMLTVLAIFLVVGIGVSIMLSGTMVKPIVNLHKGTEEIENGNLDIKVGTKARDEIGQLSRAFDGMTAQLKKSRDELNEYSEGLEETVKERTKELDDKVKETEEQKIATLNLLEDVNETKIKLEKSRLATLNMAEDLDAARRETEKAKEGIDEFNRKLKLSNQELQDFAYIVSHDLKAPVRKVSAFGELLKESLTGRLDKDEQENFEFMIEGATRMQEMIDALLTYSRVATRAKPPEPVDLNAVITDLRNVELAIPLEETDGVIEVPEPLHTVSADPSQMHQLLQNLIGNGLKYHRAGVPPVVTIRSKQDGNEVRIEVQDNGIGIEELNYDKVFGMFQRLHPGDEYEGTGVGLAVCKRIVERHGGRIGVESTPGAGSGFWFTMPGEEGG